MPIRVPAECNICGKTVGSSDMNRHMVLHAPDRDERKLKCNHPGCTFETLQKSNLKTHERRHSGLTLGCPSCSFAVYDPATLLRHRKSVHGYEPAPRRKKNDWQTHMGSNKSGSASSSNSCTSSPTLPPDSPSFFSSCRSYSSRGSSERESSGSPPLLCFSPKSEPIDGPLPVFRRRSPSSGYYSSPYAPPSTSTSYLSMHRGIRTSPLPCREIFTAAVSAGLAPLSSEQRRNGYLKLIPDGPNDQAAVCAFQRSQNLHH